MKTDNKKQAMNKFLDSKKNLLQETDLKCNHFHLLRGIHSCNNYKKWVVMLPSAIISWQINV